MLFLFLLLGLFLFLFPLFLGFIVLLTVFNISLVLLSCSDIDIFVMNNFLLFQLLRLFENHSFSIHNWLFLPSFMKMKRHRFKLSLISFSDVFKLFNVHSMKSVKIGNALTSYIMSWYLILLLVFMNDLLLLLLFILFVMLEIFHAFRITSLLTFLSCSFFDHSFIDFFIVKRVACLIGRLRNL